MICRNVKKAPKSVREQTYQTLIKPQLEYASSACLVTMAETVRHDILELEKIQHRAARFVYNNYWPLASVDTNDLSMLGWETLEARRQKVCLSMMYKAVNGLTAIPMDHYQPSMATSTRSFHGQNFTNIPFSQRQSTAGTACSDMPSHQHHYALLSHPYNYVIN